MADKMSLKAALLMIATVLRASCVAEKRPIYVMGHMANTPDDVDSFLKLGANAIEADLQFNKTNFQPEVLFHGYPCDCLRVCDHKSAVNDFFRHMRDIATTDHKNFVRTFSGLLWIELWLKGQPEKQLRMAGAAIAKLLMKTVYITKTNLKIVLQIRTNAEWPILSQIVDDIEEAKRSDILPKLGFGISGKQYFAQFVKVAGKKKYRPIGGIFISDGISNCFEMLFDPDMHKALALRDQGGSTVSNAVRWTLDTKSSIRNVLWMDIDVITSNDFHDLREVLRESEFAHRYRLATIEDDPFKRYVGGGGKRMGCSLKGIMFRRESYCWRDTDLEGGWCWTTTACIEDASVCNHNLACQ